MNSLVSIIVPVYNGDKFLRETLDSIRHQTYVDWEVIAVDDGSSDTSPVILKEFQELCPSRVTILTTSNNGVSKARNLAYKYAKGEFIAFLDQDDLWSPVKLEKQIALFEGNAQLALVYCNVSIIDQSGDVIQKEVYERRCLLEGYVFEDLLFNNFIAISSVILRSHVFEEMGMFDTRYLVCEDYDLLLKVTKTHPIGVVPMPLLAYRDHPGCTTYQKINLMIRETNAILSYWWKLVPSLFIKHPIRYIYFKIRLRFLKYKSRKIKR